MCLLPLSDWLPDKGEAVQGLCLKGEPRRRVWTSEDFGHVKLFELGDAGRELSQRHVKN